MLRKTTTLCSLVTLCVSANALAEEESEARRAQTVNDVIVRSGC